MQFLQRQSWFPQDETTLLIYCIVSVAPPVGEHFWLLARCLGNTSVDCNVFMGCHGSQRMTFSRPLPANQSSSALAYDTVTFPLASDVLCVSVNWQINMLR